MNIKRFLICLTLTLCALTASALADNRVFDDANLLSASEERALNDRIADIYSEDHFDVVLHTTDSTRGQSVRMYAADYYDKGGFGYGADGDGLIFVLSMEERDYYTVTTGRGISVFTDYGIAQIGKRIVPDLSAGRYYEAMDKYLDEVRQYLVQADTGKPYDVRTPVGNDLPVYVAPPTEKLAEIMPFILIGALVVALITVFIMRAGMKSARPRSGAGDYVISGSLNLTRREDIYLYTTTVRTKIESNSSGGSSTFRGSSGRSHGGGGGKF